MTKLTRIALILASFCTLSFAAKADDTTPTNPPVDYPQLYGSFCSAAATDGVWAFVFNGNDVRWNCNYVANVLRSATGAPIYGSNSGYYLLQGYNEAVAQCGPIRSHFYERGAFALQRAYEYARIIGGQGCLFEVYFRQ